MNFIAIVRGLEEFVYEVVTWLLFFPRLLFQQLTQPVRTMNYAKGEFSKPEETRFDAALSPLLFLLLSLMISHLIEIAVREHTIDVMPEISLGVLRSDLNLVLFRAVTFAAFPLVFAVDEIWANRRQLARSTLQSPFYVQCLPAAVYALAVGVGTSASRLLENAGAVSGASIAAASIWYLAVQFSWQKEQGRGAARAAVTALGGFAIAWMAIVATGVLLAMVEGA